MFVGQKFCKMPEAFTILQEKDQKDIIENEKRFFVVVFGEPENSFVFQKEAVRDHF